MKYLDTPILQCEIQELPEPYSARIFRKSPSSCLPGSPLSPETRAVCSWHRPDRGLGAPLSKHSRSFPCSAEVWALRCTTFVGCILLTCIAIQYVRVGIYELFIKPCEKWTYVPDRKTRKIHCTAFHKARTAVPELQPQRETAYRTASPRHFFFNIPSPIYSRKPYGLERDLSPGYSSVSKDLNFNRIM